MSLLQAETGPPPFSGPLDLGFLEYAPGLPARVDSALAFSAGVPLQGCAAQRVVSGGLCPFVPLLVTLTSILSHLVFEPLGFSQPRSGPCAPPIRFDRPPRLLLPLSVCLSRSFSSSLSWSLGCPHRCVSLSPYLQHPLLPRFWSALTPFSFFPPNSEMGASATQNRPQINLQLKTWLRFLGEIQRN